MFVKSPSYNKSPDPCTRCFNPVGFCDFVLTAGPGMREWDRGCRTYRHRHARSSAQRGGRVLCRLNSTVNTHLAIHETRPLGGDTPSPTPRRFIPCFESRGCRLENGPRSTTLALPQARASRFT